MTNDATRATRLVPVQYPFCTGAVTPTRAPVQPVNRKRVHVHGNGWWMDGSCEHPGGTSLVHGLGGLRWS